MGLKITENISDINYHFKSAVISDASISRKIRSLKLTNTFVISQYYEHRPDLISYAVYSSYDYDWLILFVNGLTSEDLVAGLTIKYPNINQLTNFLLK